MEKVRNNVKEIMETLEDLSKKDYRTFELALALFLRSDKFVLESYITDSELEKLDRIIYDSEYFMSDDLRESIDNIISDCEE